MQVFVRVFSYFCASISFLFRRDRVDGLFRAVSQLYMKPKEVHPNSSVVWVNAEYDVTEYVHANICRDVYTYMQNI